MRLLGVFRVRKTFKEQTRKLVNPTNICSEFGETHSQLGTETMYRPTNVAIKAMEALVVRSLINILDKRFSRSQNDQGLTFVKSPRNKFDKITTFKAGS